MQEHASEESPPLPVQNQRPEVGTISEKILFSDFATERPDIIVDGAIDEDDRASEPKVFKASHDLKFVSFIQPSLQQKFSKSFS